MSRLHRLPYCATCCVVIWIMNCGGSVEWFSINSVDILSVIACLLVLPS